VLAETCLPSGRQLYPAPRAFDNPIAMACFADRAPCLPVLNMLDLFKNKFAGLR